MDNGKAFEYACLKALYEFVALNHKPVTTIAGLPFNTAKAAYESIEDEKQAQLMEAANTAVNLIAPLEPKLLGGAGTLRLEIRPDAAAIGVEGDVRDVLCSRDEENWTIGLSCKHNHEALRHPRITESKDFGQDWIGTHCSEDFITSITPITDSLVTLGENRIRWNTIEQKQDRYYVPILQAYLLEIQRMCSENPTVPERLLSYFFGANDFYKVIMKSRARTTTIEGFNMHGTLNANAGMTRPRMRVATIRMPTRLIDAAMKPNSKTTIILTFDGGWSISMRLHNKDSIAKPTSLAWDVNFVGLPPSTYVNTHSWDE